MNTISEIVVKLLVLIYKHEKDFSAEELAEVTRLNVEYNLQWQGMEFEDDE